MTDSRIEKWRRWQERIEPEILTMALRRYAWDEIIKMAQANDLPASYVWEWMGENYEITQSITVRRQSEVDSRVVSIARLLDEIANDPRRITRKWWTGMFHGGEADYWHVVAQKGWRDQWAGDGDGEHLDGAIPASDLEALKAASKSVRAYVDKHIAHTDLKALATSELPTRSDLSAALDLIGDLHRKYVNLLSATSMGSVVPWIQHDWKAVFRQPWIKPRRRPTAT